MLACALALPCAQGEARVVTAAEVNGTWSGESGQFKVWALGKQRLKVEFAGAYESAQGMANTGEAHGIALIDGDTAIFEPRGVRGCRITMRFEHAKLAATQDGACGFGLNVTAEGTYRKKSRSKPRFTD
jgi:hypothetical protein